MWLDFEKKDRKTFNRPVLVVAVSTSIPQYRSMYSQARELAEYMVKKMEFERVATVYSSAFPPEVLIREGGVSTLPSCGFDVNRGKKDVVLFSGDASPMEDQHEFSQLILDYAKEIGVKELYSIGARWAENPTPEAEPVPNGFATDGQGVAKLKKNGVKIITEEAAPFFASMVVGMAADYGIRGYKLSVDHGEPSPHPKSVARLLGVLSAMAGFEIAMDELVSGAKLQPPPGNGGNTTIYK
ncbi:MAG: PAC2 family protein [Thaumarchaeota archaeon]|nr:PAC2 family protein [Nitrososphaerota archaeon]